MSEKQDLMDIIRKWEWWHECNGETFAKAAGELFDKGLTPLEIITMLDELYSAVKDEYGD